MLSLLCAAGISLNLRKFSFFKDQVEYLGQVVLPGKLDASDKAREAIRRMPFPTDKTKLKSFVVMRNVYRRFVSQYEELLKPLNYMIKAASLIVQSVRSGDEIIRRPQSLVD